MSERPIFSEAEYDKRLARVRDHLEVAGFDALLVTAPESIFYLCGLDHQGFFAFHMLIVPREGEMVLITRTMERATVEAQVTRARFVGYGDSQDPADAASRVLVAMELDGGRLAVEKDSVCFSPRVHDDLLARLPRARWHDGSHIVQQLRLVKSAEELAYVREAARVSDLMMQAALATARAGVNEQDVAAEVHRALICGGGGTPGFGPFIRTTERLGQEHTTWQDRLLCEGDILFLELSACVRRYHAPLGRLLFIGSKPEGTDRVAAVCCEAFDRVVEALRPGVTASEVYRAWQRRVDEAGIDCHRHHCGYIVGLGFPPSWSGGSRVVGLRDGSPLVLEQGMVFHLLSWLMGTGQGDYFLSNTVILGADGCEVVTRSPREVQVV